MAEDLLLEAARQDLGIYMSIVHRTDASWIAGGQAIPATHHKLIIDALMDEKAGNTLILAPRGSAKTTIVSGWIEWMMGLASTSGDKDWANNFRVIYCSATAHQAYKVSNAVKSTVQHNRVFQAIFPKVKPNPEKWSEPEWKVQGNTIKDSNFIAVGRKGPVLGSRALYVVLDDIVDEEVRGSQKEQADTREWLDNTMDKVLVPWGRMLMPCTRWYEGDPPAWAMERGWHTVMIKAVSENNESFWPERFPMEFLERKRKENPLSFALQMQNEVVPYEGILFKREWFKNRFHYPPAPDEIFRVVATWDTAGTVTGRSYSVGLVIAITKDFRYFILHMLRDKLDYPSLKKAIRDTHRIWHCGTTVIEEKATGQPAIQELQLENYNVVGVLPPGQRGGPNEFTWAETVTVPCEEGRVWLPSVEFMRRHSADDWTEEFLNEVLAYDEKTHSDIVPALTQLIYHIELMRPQISFDDAYAKLPAMRWGQSKERRITV